MHTDGLSQWNAIIAYLWFRVLIQKLVYFLLTKMTYFTTGNCYRSYSSFVASDTHFYEVDLQHSRVLSFKFETTIMHNKQGTTIDMIQPSKI